ncbi:MAG TPA: hypothetical protein VHE09_15010, partial [Rhizomicrobium sp.]|nr:hypothetical protein [Rhizomicrobium sp.]
SFLLKGLFAPSPTSATRVPRGFYDFLTVDFQRARKICFGRNFLCLQKPRQDLPVKGKFLPGHRHKLPCI